MYMVFTKNLIEKTGNLSEGLYQNERSFHDPKGRCPKNLICEERGYTKIRPDGKLIVKPTPIADSAIVRFSVMSVPILFCKYLRKIVFYKFTGTIDYKTTATT